MYLIFSLVLLLLSLYSLVDECLSLFVKKKGIHGYLTIDEVEHTFCTREGKNKKDSVAPCDYILRVSYTDVKGKVVKTRTNIKARMRIKSGKYFPFFQEGNKLKMKYLPFFKSKIFIESEQIKDKQGSVSLVIVWAFSFVILLGIFIYLILA